MKNKEIIKCLASFFYVGYLPAPGTMASIFPLLVYFLLRGNPLFYNTLTVFSLLAAFILIKKAEPLFPEKDSPHIVLDEVAGMFIVFAFVPFKWPYALIGFVLFRLFDILKIWPLKKIEKLKGSAGIVLDDVCAGVYVNIILQALLRLT